MCRDGETVSIGAGRRRTEQILELSVAGERAGRRPGPDGQ